MPKDANETKARVVSGDRVVPQGLKDFMPGVYMTLNYQLGQVNRPDWCPFADALKYAEYFCRVAEVGKVVLQQIAPEIYHDYPVKITFDPVINPNRTEGAAYQGSAPGEEAGIVYRFRARPEPGREWGGKWWLHLTGSRRLG